MGYPIYETRLILLWLTFYQSFWMPINCIFLKRFNFFVLFEVVFYGCFDLEIIFNLFDNQETKKMTHFLIKQNMCTCNLLWIVFFKGKKLD
jgi:hypothetical protein